MFFGHELVALDCFPLRYARGRNDALGDGGKKKAVMALLPTKIVIATASVAKWEAIQ